MPAHPAVPVKGELAALPHHRCCGSEAGQQGKLKVGGLEKKVATPTWPASGSPQSWAGRVEGGASSLDLFLGGDILILKLRLVIVSTGELFGSLRSDRKSRGTCHVFTQG